MSRTLVFVRTKHGADRVARKLQAAGFGAEAIHGNRNQGQRTRALEAFKKGYARVLVATEVAARGIDVDEITHVINYDLPNVPEQYVHRIGRTARAGTDGIAISFCAPDERAYLRDIEKLTKQAVPVMQTPFSMSPPRADDRTPRPKGPAGRGPQPQRKRAPQKHHASNAHGAAHKKQGHGPTRSRDDGDRRDRKGNAVWSNSGRPQQRSRKPKPQRV